MKANISMPKECFSKLFFLMEKYHLGVSKIIQILLMECDGRLFKDHVEVYKKDVKEVNDEQVLG